MTTRGSDMGVVDTERRLAQYVPVPLAADLSQLGDAERQVLGELVLAARRLDEVFLRQVWTGNAEMRARLAGWEGEEGAAVRSYFALNYGPWDRLAGFAPFVGEQAHPAGAGFYPEDMTRGDFAAWIAAHPAQREAFTSTTTVIRRRGGDLVAVPYSREYAEWLAPAAEHLRRAAAATANASLRRFLELRAAAFLDDDYYPSDVAWMDLDSPVEVTIGPYETYEDGLFGYKAAFEAFVTVALPEESAALARYKECLPWLEGNLPIAEEHKNPRRGSESPIRVADLAFAAGEAMAGVQALAFNLPNDERVREAKGSKKVLLHNTLRAKFEQILLPIAQRVLAPAQVADVAFAAYFNHVLQHELGHGLGPGTISVDGRRTEVRLELKDLYSTLEEAKADVMGVYDILALVGRGEMPAEIARTLQPTYVAGLFRSARFGLHEAHGRGVVAQFNYLLAKGGLETDGTAHFRTVPARFPGAIRELLAEILNLQATGDYDGTARFLDTYGRATPELTAAIDRLAGVPVDVRPVFSLPGL
jgi:hypothetical protein